MKEKELQREADEDLESANLKDWRKTRKNNDQNKKSITGPKRIEEMDSELNRHYFDTYQGRYKVIY